MEDFLEVQVSVAHLGRNWIKLFFLPLHMFIKLNLLEVISAVKYRNNLLTTLIRGTADI